MGLRERLTVEFQASCSRGQLPTGPGGSAGWEGQLGQPVPVPPLTGLGRQQGGVLMTPAGLSVAQVAASRRSSPEWVPRDRASGCRAPRVGPGLLTCSPGPQKGDLGPMGKAGRNLYMAGVGGLVLCTFRALSGEMDHGQTGLSPWPSLCLATRTSPALPGRGVCRLLPNVPTSTLEGSGGPRSSGFSSRRSRLPLDWEGAWSVAGRVWARSRA